MGQIEVYEILKKERLTGNEAFFCVREVAKLLTEEGFENNNYDMARKSLMKLSLSGYLEVKMSGRFSDWKRLYRLKSKYVK